MAPAEEVAHGSHEINSLILGKSFISHIGGLNPTEGHIQLSPIAPADQSSRCILSRKFPGHAREVMWTSYGSAKTNFKKSADENKELQSRQGVLPV